MKPLVSILIPCYNAAPWVGDTLKSALAQTWSNVEIILVDDGSLDASLTIARQYASERVQVVAQPNQGASAARNHALKLAQGDFIQYLDADDLLAPDKIARQLERLQRYENHVASGEWGRFYTHVEEAQFRPEAVWQDLDPVDWLVCSWMGGGMMHPAAWLLPRAVAERAGIWSNRLSLNDDGEYFSRVLVNSDGVLFCPGARTYYRSGLATSLSGTRSRKAMESAILALEFCTATLLNQENSPRTRQASATAFQRLVYDLYPFGNDLVRHAEARVAKLGGSALQPAGGPTFHALSRAVGWKVARKLQQVVCRYRSYPSVAGFA